MTGLMIEHVQKRKSKIGTLTYLPHRGEEEIKIVKDRKTMEFTCKLCYHGYIRQM